MRRDVACARSLSSGLVIGGGFLAGSNGNSIVFIAGRDISEILIKHGYSTVDRVGILFIDEFKP